MTTIQQQGLSLALIDSGEEYQGGGRNFVKRTRIYTETTTGATYTVIGMAWETGTGSIQKWFSINGVYQYEGASFLIKHASDNPYMRFCPSTRKALTYMLDYAESLVRAVALRDLAQFEAEYKAWNEKLAAV